MIEILVLLTLIAVVGVGLWLALFILRRTLKWVVRGIIAGGLVLALIIGFVVWTTWWNSDDAPRKRAKPPAATKPKR